MRSSLFLLVVFMWHFDAYSQEQSNVLTETVSEEWKNTRQLYKGINYGMTEQDVIAKFGTPLESKTILNHQFYFYCNSDSENYYLLYVKMKDEVVEDYEMRPEALKRYDNCTHYVEEESEIIAQKLSEEALLMAMATQGKVTIALFESGSTDPKLEVNAYQIAEIVKILNEYPAHYGIVGHTHNVGSSSKNLELSIERSQSVISLLEQEYGLKKDLIEARGEGEKLPLHNNKTASNRKLNSRVEFVELGG